MSSPMRLSALAGHLLMHRLPYNWSKLSAASTKRHVAQRRGLVPTTFANTGPSMITAILRPNQPRTRIMAGTLPYFTFAVLYDERNGVIGLKSR